jgi:hypothetical protein
MTAADDLKGRRRRFLTLIAALVVTVVVVAAGALVIGPRLRSPEQVAADAAPPSPSLVTAAAERRELYEPVVLRGRLRSGKSVKVLPPAAAVGPNSVVTKVRVKPGDRLVEGRVVLERAGTPMIALDLPFPLYRDITPGVSGPDVAELQRALRRIGYRVDVSAEFDAATRQQVKRMFDDRGYDETALISIPQASVLRVNGGKKRISKVNVRIGHVLLRDDQALLEIDGKPSTIVATADATQSASLRPGLTATVTDDLTGEEAMATLTDVGAEPVADDSGQNGFEIAFRFTGEPIGGGVNRSLRLDVEMTSGASEVLAVPVSAVYSRPDGSTFVTVVATDGSPTDVTVTTGQIAGGWTEIKDSEDSALADGAQVVVGEQTSE